MTPLIEPTSPRPRFRQPGCSATLRPASNRTRGNQVSEKDNCRINDGTVAPLGSCRSLFRALLASPSHSALCRRQCYIGRRFAAEEFDNHRHHLRRAVCQPPERALPAVSSCRLCRFLFPICLTSLRSASGAAPLYDPVTSRIHSLRVKHCLFQLDGRLPSSLLGQTKSIAIVMSAFDPKRTFDFLFVSSASLAISPHDLRRSPAQPHRKHAAECEEQVACAGGAALFECGILFEAHCRDFAVVHRPGAG